MKVLNQRTQYAMRVMDDFRKLNDFGERVYNKYGKYLYKCIREWQMTDLPEDELLKHTKMLEYVICIAGIELSNGYLPNSYYKQYDFATIERLRRVVEFLKENDEPHSVTLERQYIKLVSKFNKFYDYSEKCQEYYRGKRYYNDNVKLRIQRLYSECEKGNIDLNTLPLYDLQLIDEMLSEEIKQNEVTTTNYKQRMKDYSKQIKLLNKMIDASNDSN